MRFFKKGWYGYHYTSKKNWEEIKKNGKIEPRHIKNESVTMNFPETGFYVQGIWLWPKKPTTRSHVGNIMWTVSQKNTMDVVRLKIKFKDYSKILKNDNYSKVKIYHDGFLGNFKYHSRVRTLIWTESIPLSDIVEVDEYNLEKILTSGKKRVNLGNISN